MISVAIMAHKKRERFIPELVDSLDEEPVVIWDRKNNRWDTGSRAMLAFHPRATHHLVVQDDAVVCRDLVATLRRAVQVSGNNPVCLYTGRSRPAQGETLAKVTWAVESGSPWFVMPGPKWGVGVLVPTPLIAPMVEWCNAHPITENYDLRMERWFVTQGIQCWYTIPSLVEHRHGGDNPSLVQGRWAQNRRAWEFIGADYSGLGIDWTQGPTSPVDGCIYLRPHWACTVCGFRTNSKAQAANHHRRKHVLTRRFAQAMKTQTGASSAKARV